MIDRDNDLSLTRQAEVLQLSRSGLYYEPKPISAADLDLMRRIDRLHPNGRSWACECCAIGLTLTATLWAGGASRAWCA